jgi:tyrosine-protein kinase Etk/Wzc
MAKENSESTAEPVQPAGEIRSEHRLEPVGAPVLNFLAVLTKWRRFIVRFVFVCTVVVVVIAFQSPKWYKATACVLPAEKTDLLSNLEGVSSLVKTFSSARSLSALTGPTEAERYLAILQSENVLWRVIERFDLVKVYEIKQYPREKTIKELLSNVDFEIADEGQLLISVYDKDPQRAADMANYFVQLLNEINSELHGQNARADREFIETRYEKNIADLRAAEDSLKMFQKKFGVYSLTEALSGKFLSSFVPFQKVPEVMMGYVTRYRDLEIQNKILEFVLPLYEQAKVEEKRNSPSVIVLDSALVPERKAKPKVSLYGLLALVISTFVALGFVFSVEGVRKLRSIDPERADSLWAAARSDWFGLGWRRRRKK